MLLKEGYVHSIKDAFDRYIGNRRPCYVKKFKLTPAEAIEMIKRLRGIAVLAHPYVIASDQLIIELIQLGLRGIEVYYPEHDQSAIDRYKNMAEKYGLLLTGGSDCHGLGKNKIMIGAVKIPYNLVEALKAERRILENG